MVTAVLGLDIRRSAPGQYLLTLAGAPGQTYIIQSSSNLSSWTPVSTNTAPADATLTLPINIQDASHAFYRAVLAP